MNQPIHQTSFGNQALLQLFKSYLYSRPEGKARVLANSKRHREKEGYAEKHRSYRDKPTGIMQYYRTTATSKGLPFELTLEDILAYFWQKSCHYCGELLRTTGIDRVDNTKGYTLDNTVPCCSTCNYMKNKYDLNTFLTKCQQIAKKWA